MHPGSRILQISIINAPTTDKRRINNTDQWGGRARTCNINFYQMQRGGSHVMRWDSKTIFLNYFQNWKTCGKSFIFFCTTFVRKIFLSWNIYKSFENCVWDVHKNPYRSSCDVLFSAVWFKLKLEHVGTFSNSP
jgi:hypothetical protein